MKLITKHVVEIKRNFWGKEVKRVEYDIEVPQECNHRWVYDNKYGVGRECELCGVRQEWTGDFRPMFRDDYFVNEWLQVKQNK